MSEVPEVTARVETAVDDLDATIKDIRRSIFALGATETAADIRTELTRMVDRAATTLKFRPRLELQGPVGSRVSDDVAPHLLAVLGEALSNAARHAGATRVDVRISAEDQLELVVADDGGGLPADVRESGLRNIRDRAVQLGRQVRGRLVGRGDHDHLVGAVQPGVRPTLRVEALRRGRGPRRAPDPSRRRRADPGRPRPGSRSGGATSLKPRCSSDAPRPGRARPCRWRTLRTRVSKTAASSRASGVGLAGREPLSDAGPGRGSACSLSYGVLARARAD